MFFDQTVVASLLATSTLLLASACADGPSPQRQGPSDTQAGDIPVADAAGDATATTPQAEVADDSALADDLRFLREEEKLARDVYRTLSTRWGLQVFDNIAGSEQSHTTRVATRMGELGLADPVVDDTTGVFVDEALAALYPALVAQGEASTAAALQVGATIEDLDLRDLAAMRTRTDDAATLAVYDALMCGSRNHLRAFVGQLAAQGAGYVAQYLEQDAVDAIVASPHEACGGR